MTETTRSPSGHVPRHDVVDVRPLEASHPETWEEYVGEAVTLFDENRLNFPEDAIVGWVVLKDGWVVGALGYNLDGTFSRAFYVVVDEANRRQGIATDLVAVARDDSRQVQEPIYAVVINPHMEPLLERLGFNRARHDSVLWEY